MKYKTDNKLFTSANFDVIRIKTESNYGVLKTIIVALLIVLQFTLLLLSFLYLYTLFTSLIVFSLVISVIFSIIVLSSKRTGQTKAIWILFMLICFTFGWFVFLLSNEKIMFGKNKKRYQKIFEKSKFDIDHDYSNLLPKPIANDCNYLANCGNFPIYANDNSQYFSNGATLFDSILNDISQAKKFIFIEYFIISDGVLLNRFLDILGKKAQEGLDIRIIYDDLGSHAILKRKTRKKIKKLGIKLLSFNKLVPIFNLALNLRDHRKIVVIDGKIAYTGGANLADEYINEKRTHGYWKDSGIKICGDSVNTFTRAFLRQWEFLTNKHENYNKYLNNFHSKTKYPSNEICIPYVTGPDYSSNIAKDTYENMIANANEKIYIMTPYFIPDESMLNILKNKAQSGVDVRIILPEIPDKRFVFLISLDGAESLIEYGVKIYLMHNSFVHSKVVLTEKSCVVGTINIDQRSFYQQFESAVYTNSSDIMTSVNEDFITSINRSKLHVKNKKGIIKNILVHILRLISPLM